MKTLSVGRVEVEITLVGRVEVGLEGKLYFR